MTRKNLHAIIIGAGIGGLCLAQGLIKNGIDVSVFERDRSPADRLQGYRLNINEEGVQALKKCLPEELHSVFLSTCGYPSDDFNVYDKNMKELLSINMNGSSEEIKAVSRMTLRQVLLSGLSDSVHFNKKFIHYGKTVEDKVEAYFEDGTSAVGDVMIAADGANSEMRKQFLPQAKRVDTGIVSIVGKIPLTDQVRTLLPADTFSILGARGVEMSMTLQEFQNKLENESSEYDSGILFDNTQDYLMWGIFGRKEKFENYGDVLKLDSEDLEKLVMMKIKNWHPNIQKLMQFSDSKATSIFPIYTSEPVEKWETENISLLGDAIHSMTPMNGLGANMALKDAELLCNNLIEVVEDKLTLKEAIEYYETQMLDYGFEAVRISRKTAEHSSSDSIFSDMFTKLLLKIVNKAAKIKRRIF